MKYTGRVTGTIVAVIIFVCIRMYAYIYLNYPLTNPPVLLPVFLLLVWMLGKQYDKVKYYSEVDVLTALFNRRYVYTVFPDIIAQADKKNEEVSICIIDCDKFKVINDSLGHNQGDIVLREIAALLRSIKRKTDIAARWGGDEFLIIAPFTDERAIQKMTSRLKTELKELSCKLHIDLSVSCGCATYPLDAKDMDGLLKIADSRMFKEK